MKQIELNNNIAISGEWFTGVGIGENLGYFNQRTVIYEVGTGISTCNKDKWAKIIKQDFIETDELIFKIEEYEDKRILKVKVYKNENNA